MKRNTIGVISFFAEYGAIILICLLTKYSGDYTIRFTFLYFITQIVFGHYQAKTLLIWEEFRILTTSHLCFYLASLLLLPVIFIDMKLLLEHAIITAVMLLFCIVFARFIRVVLREFLKDRVLIIGVGKEAVALSQVCKKNRFSLMQICGYVRLHDTDLHLDVIQEMQNEDEKPIYDIQDLARTIDSQRIDQVIIAAPEMSKQCLDNIMNTLRGKIEKIKYVPLVNGIITFDSTIEDFDGLLVISSSKEHELRIKKAFKRVFDMLIGLLGCILLLPLTFYVVWVNRRAGDRDPVFFIQKRIGRDGKLFSMYKYRTMMPNAEAELERLMKENPAIRKEYLENKKLENDPRITEVGAFLRKKSLDEFPQMINLVKGNMSLVGPRPYLPREKKDMGLFYKPIINSKPGVTGMWQCHGRNEIDFEDRCRMDVYYYSNWSLWLDITILIKTIKVVFYGKGAR